MLGVVNPSYSQLITFDLDQGETQMPSFIAFQILVTIQNLVIHRCIIDEGESTCFMLNLFWNKFGSPTLQTSSTALRAYDVHVSQPQ